MVTDDRADLADLSADQADSAGGETDLSDPGTDSLDQRTKDLLARAAGRPRPITDTHVHFFQPSRPGVAWPQPGYTTLFKDFLPQAYMDMATPLGILGAGIVEASPWIDDTQWVLAQTARTPASKDFFTWYMAQLDIGSADFIRNLTSYLTVDAATNPDADKIVGLRVYLWSASIDPADPIQRANLTEVQSRGLTLELISRGTGPNEQNPKVQVVALATAFPGIRIVIDHLAGAKIAASSPDPRWMTDIAALAARPNIHVKMSGLFDAANTTGDGSQPWTAPKDMPSYKPILDALWTAFGEDRLIWGSNYPLSLLAGTVQEEIKIAEDYLVTKAITNSLARDKIMFDNAILFHRRLPPGTAATPDARTLALLARKNGKTRPIMDTHVHVYQPSRPGVLWPDSSDATLFRDYLPTICISPANAKAPCGPTYKDETAGQGIVAANVVEASPRSNDATGAYDTDWVLSQLRGNDLFFNYTAQLDIGAKDFIRSLDRNAEGMTADGVDRRLMVSGVRAYYWNAAIAPTDPTQAANLAELQRRGMTLDIISRGTPPSEKNPKAQVAALATAFPNLRIIIDHLAGARIADAAPDPGWIADVASLAAHPNIYLKWSAFFDAANATDDETKPWTAPKDVAMYTPIFDALFNAFGEDRIIWGSNWPVVKLAGSLTEEIQIAENYLASKAVTNPLARDKVMFRNGILFYRRIPPR